MNERAERIAEETRLRDEAQKWAGRLKEARENADVDEFDIEAEFQRASRAYETFLSGFDSGEED